MQERKIDEVFNFKGEMLQVKDIGNKACCDGCYFDESKHKCSDVHNCIGYCYEPFRSDGKDVVFVEVRDDKEKEYQQ